MLKVVPSEDLAKMVPRDYLSFVEYKIETLP